jgi:hypothetical protein
MNEHGAASLATNVADHDPAQAPAQPSSGRLIYRLWRPLIISFGAIVTIMWSVFLGYLIGNAVRRMI